MSKFTSFLMGGIIGAAVALLFTPRNGEQNRAFINDQVNALTGQAQSLTAGMPEAIQDSYRSVVDQGTSIVNNAVERGTDLVNTAASRVKEVSGQIKEEADSDELRDKIEAARQRIASQVMENAEAAKATAAKATEAAAHTAQAAAKSVESATASASAKISAAGEKAAEAKDAKDSPKADTSKASK